MSINIHEQAKMYTSKAVLGWSKLDCGKKQTLD